MYSALAETSGTGSPTSTSPLRCAVSASFIYLSASSFVLPVAKQVGASGVYGE